MRPEQMPAAGTLTGEAGPQETSNWCRGGGRAEYEAHVALWPFIRAGLPRPTWDELSGFERASWSRPVKDPLIRWPEGYAALAAAHLAAPATRAPVPGDSGEAGR